MDWCICGAVRSKNVEHGLELDHELPVVLAEFVAEVRLARLDRLAGDLAEELVLVVKVPPKRALLRASRYDLPATVRRT